MADNMFQSSNQTVQSTTGGREPWAPAQDAMKLGIKDATALYNNKSGFQPFGKSLVADRSTKTTEGMGGIENSSRAFGADLAKPLGFNTGILNSGGWNTPQLNAMDNSARVASGDELFGSNPGFQRILRSGIDDITEGVNRNASAMGRYGSGTHQDVLQEGIADFSGRMHSDEYQRQLGRMDAANQQMFGMGQQGIGNQAAASDQLASSYNLMQQPYRDLMGVGQMEEDYAAAQLQDELRVHQEAQAEPWDRLLALQGIATGAGRVGGSSNQTSTVIRPGTSPFQAMVGGGLQAYDQGMDPWMGALAGYLGGSSQ
jgi:hypothetical protein